MVKHIIRKAYVTSNEAVNVRDKAIALNLLKDTIGMRFDLHTDSAVNEQAIKLLDNNNKVQRDQGTKQDRSNIRSTEQQATKQQPIGDNDIIVDTAVDNSNIDTSDIEPDTIDNELVSRINEANESAANEPEPPANLAYGITEERSHKPTKTFKVKQAPVHLHVQN